jgi:hypothetical protein
VSDAVKVGDLVEDDEGDVWAVAEVVENSPSQRYQVRLERTTTVEKWAGLDDFGPSRRYETVRRATDA